MVDTARPRFPDDMVQVARLPDARTMETFTTEALNRVKQYARDEPLSFAAWAFGIGFVLGWRLKPW